MYEILHELPAHAVVLDLGCARGSFPASVVRCRVLRLDLEHRSQAAIPNVISVQGNGACLPLRDNSTDFVVCNHSLEHIDRLNETLVEIGRVLKPGAPLFVSVPDASTITDKIYRWLGKGGGHINAFTNPDLLAEQIAGHVKRPHRRTWTLFTSLSFLNRSNIPGRRQRKLLLFCGGNEKYLALLLGALNLIDRVFRTRLSVYGWAMYFGEPSITRVVQSIPVRRNMCVRCGSAFSYGDIRTRTRRFVLFSWWRCPACTADNLLLSRL